MEKRKDVGEIQSLIVRIFISSPGDVSEERAITLRVLQHLQERQRYKERVWFKALSWDAPGATVAKEATETPRLSVNRAIGSPTECDLVVVILRSKLGTPLLEHHRKPDGTLYASGTGCEFDTAIRAHESSNGRPRVLVYRRMERIALDPEDDDFDERTQQRRAVKKFFEKFNAASGAILRGVDSYETTTEFEKDFDTPVRDWIDEILEQHERAGRQTSLRSVTSAAPQGPPFPSLRAFKQDEASFFSGRGPEFFRAHKLLIFSREMRKEGAIDIEGPGLFSDTGLTHSCQPEKRDFATDETTPKRRGALRQEAPPRPFL